MPSRSTTGRKRGAPRGNTNARRHGFYARVPEHDKGDDAHVASSPPGDGAGLPPPAPTSPAPIPALETIITDLYARQTDLKAYLDDLPAEFSEYVVDRRLAALHLYRQNAATLGRLIRDFRLLNSPEGDRISHAINAALDRLSEDWDVPL